MTTAKLKENYEKHLEANWTREGERKPYDAWRNDVMFAGVNYFNGECEPTVSVKRTLTVENLEEIYSKPLLSQYSGDVCARCGVAEEQHDGQHSYVSNRGFYKWVKENDAN